MAAGVVRTATTITVLAVGLALGAPPPSVIGMVRRPADAQTAAPVEVPDVDPSALTPGDLDGELSTGEIRQLVAAGRVPAVPGLPETGAGPGEPAGSDAAGASPADPSTTDALVSARVAPTAASSGAGTTYSIDGTIYDIGQGSSGPLAGHVEEATLSADGTMAVVQYWDPQWESALFFDAPWNRSTIGIKSLANGHAAPVSFDAKGRAVPARLEAVSPNGRWIAFTGPDMDQMYGDPDNLGVLYVLDTTTLHVTETSLADFGVAEESGVWPAIRSLTDDGSRLTWNGCIAVVGGDTCASSVPGIATISADGSSVVYQGTDMRLYRTGAGGGSGALVSTDEFRQPVEVRTWAQSADGSVIAYTSAQVHGGYPYTFTYAWTQGQVTSLLQWGYFTHVTALSADGSLVGFSHPHGSDSQGFMTLAAGAVDSRTGEFVDLGVGPDGMPLPHDRTNYITGMSSDGTRVALMSDSTAYVFDRTGEPPAELLARVPGTGAYGYNYDAWAADPVNTRTGAFEMSATDASLPSRGPRIAMTRAYSSDLTRSGRLGPGWTDSFDSTVTTTGAGEVTVVAPDGAVLDFTERDGEWVSTAVLRAALTRTATGWSLTADDGTAFDYDEDGRLAGARTADGQGWTVHRAGSTQTVTTSAGESLTFVERDGRLRSVELPDGRRVEYEYTDGRLTTVTDASGHPTTYEYDDDDRMVRSTDAAGDVQFENTFGDDGRIVSQVDAAGAVTSFSWDPDQQAASVTGPGGDTWVYVYRGGLLMWSRDPDGVERQHVYDGDLNLVTVVTDGRATAFEYDDQGHPVGATWPDGSGIALQLDPAGRPLVVSDAAGVETRYVYDDRGHLLETHLPDGRVARNEWDPVTGLRTAAVSPAGRVTRFTYDDAGQVTSVTTPEGRVTSYVYDELGRVTAYTTPHAPTADPLDYTWTVAYSADGTGTTVTDPLGGRRAVEYDAIQRPRQVTDARGGTTAYTYTSAHELQTVVDPLDGTTGYSYDDYGWLAGREDQNGNVQAYQHDALGRVRSIVEPDGAAWTFGYDGGRLEQVSDPNAGLNPTAGTTSYGFDDHGRLTALVPQQPTSGGGGGGVPTASRHAGSAAAQVTARTVEVSPAADEPELSAGEEAEGDEPEEPVGDEPEQPVGDEPVGDEPEGDEDELPLEHSPFGWLTGAADDETILGADGRAGGLRVTGWVEDDDRGEAPIDLVATVDDDSTYPGVVAPGATDFTISVPLAPGLHTVCVTAVNVGAGQDTSLGCVSGEVLTRVGRYLPSPAASFDVRRDGSGRVAGLSVWDDALQQTVDSVAWTWDVAGRMTSVTRDGRTVAYEWDADDRLVGIEDARGAAVARTYTEDGLLASVSTDGATVTYTYDEAGNQVRTEYPDGSSEERTHDVLGRVTSIALRTSAGTVTRDEYEYDAEGNPVRVVAGGVEHFAEYDAKNQLTDWCTVTPCEPGSPGLHYTYDAAGNRLTETRDDATTTYAYDGRNRLTRVTGPDGSVRTMDYDAAGRLIRDGERWYRYDALGRLTSVDDPDSGVTSYTYTADGLLSTRSHDQVTTSFVWDTTSGAPRLLSQSGGAADTSYVHGSGLLAVDGPVDAWVHIDRLGSTAGITVDGELAASLTYEPFGGLADPSGSPTWGTDTVAPTFAGTPTDPATGLMLMGARAYDPTVGRFLTFDPAPVSAYEPAVSTYVYVNNRPTVLIDPTGLRGVATEYCPAWLCTIYSLDQIMSTASGIFTSLTAVSGAVSLVAPPVGGIGLFYFGVAAGVTGGAQVATGLTITVYDARTGGDWQCEAVRTGAALATMVGGRALTEAGAAALGTTRASRTDIRRVLGPTVEGGGGTLVDGLLGQCSRPGS